MTATPNRRPAFTLVEMLVASALIIFMMYIITTAFESGLTSFRVLKAQGEQQEKLRILTTTLRMDLTAEHFGGDFFPPSQGPYLSHQRLNDQTWTPPQKGYFRIVMPNLNLPGAAEGTDPDGTGMRYFRLVDPTTTYLQFTVNMTDGHPASRDGRTRRDQFQSTDAVGIGGMHHWNKPDYNIDDVPFSSNWAEVTWFLQANGQFTSGGGPLPLYTLFRRHKMLVEPSATAARPLDVPPQPPPQNDPRYPLYQRVNPSDPAYPPRTFPRILTAGGETHRDFPDVSTWYRHTPVPQQQQPFPEYVFNSPSDVTQPVRRWGMSFLPYPLATPPLAHGQPQPFLSPLPPRPLPFNPILTEAEMASPANPYADPKLGPRVGGDVVLTDIVNFEVKVLWEPVRLGAPNTERFFPEPTTANPNPTIPIAPEDGTEPQGAPDGVGNPDYPFDRLPPLAAQTNPVNPAFRQTGVRVFDTWSANNDLSGAVPYLYGVDPFALDEYDYVPITAKATSSTDPSYANWNAGHFRPPTRPAWKQRQQIQPPPRFWYLAPPLTPLPHQTEPPLPQTNLPTQANTNIPLRVRVRALQIKVRIWDRKTNQTRQVTIIQDV